MADLNLTVRSDVLTCSIRKFYMNSTSYYHEPDKVNFEMTYIQQYTKKY